MLKSISWHDLIHVIMVVFALYYLGFLLICLRKELGAILKGKKRLTPPPAEKAIPIIPSDLELENLILAEMAAFDLSRSIEKMAGDRVEKPDFLSGIASGLTNCTHLRKTSYQTALTFWIVHQAGKHHVDLDVEDVSNCWSRAAKQ